MGNVWAYDAALHWIESLSPRFVLLLGLAGGDSRAFRRGDAAYVRLVGYSSFAKIESETVAEAVLRHGYSIDPDSDAAKVVIPQIKLRETDPIECWPAFETFAGEKARQDEWQKCATSWWNEFAQTFAAERAGVEDLREPLEQITFERGTPRAAAAVAASGDAIVASEEIKREIAQVVRDRDKRTKRDAPVTVFEMELFGVALCCKNRNVPFAMIKGISDFAGDDKRGKADTKDAYRLAALASATALTMAIVSDSEFIADVRRHAPHAWSRNACVWVSQGDNGERVQQCTASDGVGELELFRRTRPCSKELNDILLTKQELFGARVLEGVHLNDYSDYLVALLDRAATMILVFPYDVSGLIELVQAADPALGKEAVLLGHLVREWQSSNKGMISKNERRRLRKGIVEHAMSLGYVMHAKHRHFVELDQRCARMIQDGCSVMEIAKQYCRIVYIRDADATRMAYDLGYLLHIVVCGVCVPTFVVREPEVDEATYVRLKPEHTLGDPTWDKGPVTLYMEYSEGSKLLTLASTCRTVPESRARVFTFAGGLWKWLEEMAEGDQEIHGRWKYGIRCTEPVWRAEPGPATMAA